MVGKINSYTEKIENWDVSHKQSLSVFIPPELFKYLDEEKLRKNKLLSMFQIPGIGEVFFLQTIVHH